MKKALPLILLLAAAAAGAWYWSVWKNGQAVSQVEVLPPPPLKAEPEPEPISYPVEEITIQEIPVSQPEPPPEPLPSLQDSDSEVLGEMEAELGSEALEQYFALDLVISRLVATLDSLTSVRVAPQMLPVKAPDGSFMVLGEGEEAAISPENPARYQALVDVLLSIDTDWAVSQYVHYYPLFQEAYEAQGYPEAYFNDRLVEVLDHLLQTPQPAGMLSLVQNEAVWEFADPSLESLSAGQKMMLRLDAEQSAAVRIRLREFRAAVSGLDPALQD